MMFIPESEETRFRKQIKTSNCGITTGIVCSTLCLLVAIYGDMQKEGQVAMLCLAAFFATTALLFTYLGCKARRNLEEISVANDRLPGIGAMSLSSTNK